MAQTRIEIRDVQAHGVDAEGRVRGVRVVGVADRRDRRIVVTLELKANKRLSPGQDFKARESAAFVTPASVGMDAVSARFAQAPGSQGQARTGFFWCAEFELEAHPQLPPIELGIQCVPLSVSAIYLSGGDDDAGARTDVLSLALVPAYPVGVLFVHGIGLQAKSETVSEWTAPLLRWLNDWFDAGRRHLGARAKADDLDGWLAELLLREKWEFFDADAGDRFELAMAFADRVDAKRHAGDTERLLARGDRMSAMSLPRKVEPKEAAAAARFAQHVSGELGVDVVGGIADLADARLLDGDAPASRPSTVEIRLRTLSAQGDVERSRWLMAESHWAESFRPPDFARFGAWCLGAAPLIWVHAYAMARERGNRSRARAALVLVPLATVVLGLSVAFALLLLLSVIPWPRLRAALMAAQRRLAGVVGDSYVFLHDPVQRRAIIDRVQRDVEWLSRRCRKVVVVAHSQGAAAADRALNDRRDYTPARLDTLVTLGAGVQPLKRLAELAEDRGARMAGLLALAAVAVFWAGAAALALAGSRGSWPAAAAILAAAIALIAAGGQAWAVHQGLPASALYAGALKPWQDFFARRDPVPWGPQVRALLDQPFYTPHDVRNRDSYLTDHTTYWKNGEEVVGPVARLIARAAGATAVERALPARDSTQAALVAARHARVDWLRLARLVALGCTAGLCAVAWRPAGVLAEWGWHVAQARPGPQSEMLSTFPGMAPTEAVLAVFLPWAVYALLLNGAWAAWGGAEARAILCAQGAARANGWRLVFAGLLAGLVGVTLVLVANALR